MIAAGSIAISPDGETAYLGRAIVGGWPQQGALAFATRDGALLGWAPGQQDRYSVDALAVARDGQSVFLESSPTVGTRRQQAAMLDETGGITPWVEPNKLAGQIGSIHLDGDGTVYYTRLGSTPAISAVTADGTLRWRLAFGGGAGGVTLTPDEQTLYVTGSFTSLGGEPRPGLAAVRAADGALLPWPLTVQGGNVESSVFSSDGRTQYLKGTFTSVNGVPRAGLAAVDAATNTVLPFNPNVNGKVAIMRLTPDDSKLIVGGTFGEVDTPSRAYLLGLRTTDGAIVFRPPTVKSNVRTFVPLLDNRTLIVASGSLLWSFDTRDSGELEWRISGCGDCVVNSIALDPDGRTLHVAGLMVIGGQQYHYLRLAVSRVPAAPVNGRPPAVIGAAQPGRFVECDPGTWSGHPSQYRFSWSLDGTTVPEFTGREFLVMEPDVGRTLGCSVRAFGAGTSATADSAPVSVTAGASPFQPVPRRTALPLGDPAPTPTPTATPEPTATATPSDRDRDARPDRDAGQDRLRRRAARAHADTCRDRDSTAGAHRAASRRRPARARAGAPRPQRAARDCAPREAAAARLAVRGGDRHHEAARDHAELHARRRHAHVHRSPSHRPLQVAARAPHAHAAPPRCGRQRARGSLPRVILTQRQLNRALLARQGLLERRPLSIPDALDAMGTLQAQYAPSMYIGLWSRIADLRRDALTEALHERTVVQGTLMRATIHLVSAGRLLAVGACDPRAATRDVAPGHQATGAGRGRGATPGGTARRADEAGRDRGADRQGGGARCRDVARPRACAAGRHVGTPSADL